MNQDIDIADLRTAIEEAEHKPGQWARSGARMGGICTEGVALLTMPQKEDVWAGFSHKRDSWLAIKAVNALPALLDRLEQAEMERDDLLALVPRTPEQMIAFIGGNFNSKRIQDERGKDLPPEDVTFSLTVHDLLSAFSWAGLHDIAEEGGAAC